MRCASGSVIGEGRNEAAEEVDGLLSYGHTSIMGDMGVQSTLGKIAVTLIGVLYLTPHRAGLPM